nr:twin-arginine translocase subunit TatC [Akkermansiaceae bacterium]
MFLLKKLFQIRDKANPELEKPFLEHLEDLRMTITKIIATLVVTMIACFAFHKDLMEVMRRPVDKVWETKTIKQLPTPRDGAAKPLTVELWEEAKAVDRAIHSLGPSERTAFFAQLENPDLVFHARSVGLLRACLAVPEKNRAAFLDALGAEPELTAQVLALVKKAPETEMDNRGNLRFMSALKPTETFVLSMKLSFFAGIVLAFPLLLGFILQFVLPGLHSNEKKALWPALGIGFGLFLAGVLFAYFVVLPRALGFFYQWGGDMGVSNDWRIGEYITFATQFTLLFGVAFELPVVVMFLVMLGILNYPIMAKTRRYAIVAIFVAAAILTPTPDVLTLGLMAAPMVVLYEICIWLAWFLSRKERLREEREKQERQAYLASLPAPETADDGSPNPDGGDDSPDAGDTGWTDFPGGDDAGELPSEPGGSQDTAAEMTDEPGDYDWRADYPDLTPIEPPVPQSTTPGDPKAPFPPINDDLPEVTLP